jgi:hypothetical protein
MAREFTYCDDCGARLTLYVVGVCPRCDFDRTGNDPERDEREAIDKAMGGPVSDSERTEP